MRAGAGIRSRKSSLTLSDRCIMRANTELIGGHLYRDTARFAFVNCATRSSATQIIAIQREGGRMTLRKHSLIIGEDTAQFAAEQQTLRPYEKEVVVRAAQRTG